MSTGWVCHHTHNGVVPCYVVMPGGSIDPVCPWIHGIVDMVSSIEHQLGSELFKGLEAHQPLREALDGMGLSWDDFNVGFEEWRTEVRDLLRGLPGVSEDGSYLRWMQDNHANSGSPWVSRTFGHGRLGIFLSWALQGQDMGDWGCIADGSTCQWSWGWILAMVSAALYDKGEWVTPIIEGHLQQEATQRVLQTLASLVTASDACFMNSGGVQDKYDRAKPSKYEESYCREQSFSMLLEHGTTRLNLLGGGENAEGIKKALRAWAARTDGRASVDITPVWEALLEAACPEQGLDLGLASGHVTLSIERSAMGCRVRVFVASFHPSAAQYAEGEAQIFLDMGVRAAWMLGVCILLRAVVGLNLPSKASIRALLRSLGPMNSLVRMGKP